MASTYQTEFQREFEAKKSYSLDYIKKAIQKNFLDESGKVCSDVSISEGLESLTMPTAEDLYAPFENHSKDARIEVIECMGSCGPRNIKFALTAFKPENENYLCLEKRLV